MKDDIVTAAVRVVAAHLMQQKSVLQTVLTFKNSGFADSEMCGNFLIGKCFSLVGKRSVKQVESGINAFDEFVFNDIFFPKLYPDCASIARVPQ